jgi:hypothetical protein
MSAGSAAGARRIACALVVLAVVLSSAPASAQLTLLLRADDALAPAVEPGIDEALRDGVGGSVRRLEPSLDDIALAAGCEGDPAGSLCIARVASAAGAQLVVIERVVRGGPSFRVDLVLHGGADGTRLRTIHLDCASPTGCAEDVAAALGTSTERFTATHAGRVEAARAPAPARVVARADHDAPLGPNLLFASAFAASVVAIIAGAIGVQAAGDGADLGAHARRDQIGRELSLASTRDWALGTAATFAGAGACLAVAGLVAMVLEEEDGHGETAPRVAAAIDGSGATISIAGSF